VRFQINKIEKRVSNSPYDKIFADVLRSVTYCSPKPQNPTALINIRMWRLKQFVESVSDLLPPNLRFYQTPYRTPDYRIVREVYDPQRTTYQAPPPQIPKSEFELKKLAD